MLLKAPSFQLHCQKETTVLIKEHSRKALFFTSLSAIGLSVVLDANFATDGISLPEPNMLSLLAIGGVAGVVAALIGRRKK